MGRGGATSSRGRGKFKVSRGGGRHFSRDLDPRDILKGNVRSGQGDDSDEDEDEESSEEESEDEVAENPDEPKLSKEMAALNLKLGNTEVIAAPEEDEMSRADRKALKKAQADAKAKKAAAKTGGGKQVKFGSDSDSESESEEDEPVQQKPKPKAAELSRKEREAADKKAAQERYAKLHAQGKTTEAKTDLARLQEVRRRREAAAAQREAEAEEAAKEAEAKKAKAAGRKL